MRIAFGRLIGTRPIWRSSTKTERKPLTLPRRPLRALRKAVLNRLPGVPWLLNTNRHRLTPAAVVACPLDGTPSASSNLALANVFLLVTLCRAAARSPRKPALAGWAASSVAAMATGTIDHTRRDIVIVLSPRAGPYRVAGRSGDDPAAVARAGLARLVRPTCSRRALRRESPHPRYRQPVVRSPPVCC